MAKAPTIRQRALAAGYRSGLEEIVAARLTRLGIAHDYEQHTVKYTVPSRVASYRPDFVLTNGIVVETKGRWVSDDRKKIELVRKQFPKLDLRILFMRDQPITKGSKTRYSTICQKLGVPFAVGQVIPDEWLEEPPNEASLALLKDMRK